MNADEDDLTSVAAAERDAQQAAKHAALRIALSEAPVVAWSNKDRWDKYVATNKDPYGTRILRFAEEWARLMQAHVAAGGDIADCAESAAATADDNGITGFMYNAAVNVLADCWEHGKALQRWHRRKT